jgi:spore germination cell wall hydrolase CwlJ-like protein
MVLNAAKTLCDLFYLAFTIWREARGVSRAAQIAVGWTLLNRVKRPGWWGTSIDSVSTKRLQYSSLTDPNDKQLTTWPLLTDASWLACLGVAYDILHGEAVNLYPGADSYYDDSIAAPKWTKDAVFCGKIDNLLFYDVDHDHETEAIVAADTGTDFEKTLRDWLAAPKG